MRISLYFLSGKTSSIGVVTFSPNFLNTILHLVYYRVWKDILVWNDYAHIITTFQRNQFRGSYVPCSNSYIPCKQLVLMFWLNLFIFGVMSWQDVSMRRI
jgi:hypothetical protein